MTMDKFNSRLRLLPIIGITLTIIGYLYLTYETFDLNKRKIKLTNEVAELENAKLRHTIEAKLRDSIIYEQETIISNSGDSETVRQGEQLKVKFNEPASNHFTVTKKEDANLELAEKYELEGFNYLLQKDVNNAILSFRKSENSYNGFHMVYDIATYLVKNKSKLSDKNSAFWQDAYLIILKDYSWKMPIEIKAKLEEITK
jgi:hypothetical protein